LQVNPWKDPQLLIFSELLINNNEALKVIRIAKILKRQ
jgi:hypothetical protein